MMSRVLLTIVVLVTGVALAVALSLAHAPAPADDFISYWAAARLLAHGLNPYDPAVLLAAQQSAGWPYQGALPVWYGPWILTTTIPVGLMSYWVARVAWVTAQGFCLGLSAILLWRVYGGSGTRPLVLVATFAPSVLCVFEGQITPFVLLGLTGFLVSVERSRDWRAGAALFPVTAKPLTAYLLWLGLAWWTLRSRRGRVLGGLLLAVGAASLVTVTMNGSAFAQWLQFSALRSPLTQTYTPTIGALLRDAFGRERLWLAYVPAGGGILWWLMASMRRGGEVAWKERIPALLLVSLLTSPFAWSHDALLLLPVVMRAAAKGWSRADARFWLLSNGLAVGLYPVLRYQQTPYLLYPLALLLWQCWRPVSVETAQRDSPAAATADGSVLS